MTPRVSRRNWCAGLSALVASLVLVPAAVAAGELVAEPEDVAFGAVTANEQRSIPLGIRNIGPDPVTLGDIWLVYDEGTTVEPFSVDPGSCSEVLVLEADTACEMTVTFVAPQQSGSFEALVVAEGDGVDPAVALLTGQAVPPPAGKLVAEPTYVGFPRTRIDAVSVPKQVRVRNVGTGPVAVPPASVNNSHFGIVSNDCPPLLAPGAQCSVGVVFKPTDGPPLPMGAAVGLARQSGGLFFGQRLPVSGRYELSAYLTGDVAPRLDPTLVGTRLARLPGSAPRALRGGPRHGRLSTFKAPVAGSLAVRVYGWAGRRRVLVAEGGKRLAEGVRHRLRIALTRTGRKMLREPKQRRVKVVLSFTRDDGTVSKLARERIVKPPKVTKKKRKRR